MVRVFLKALTLVRQPKSKYGTVEIIDKDKIRYNHTPDDISVYDTLRYILCPNTVCADQCDSAWVYILLQATYYYRLIFVRDQQEELLDGPVHLFLR